MFVETNVLILATGLEQSIYLSAITPVASEKLRAVTINTVRRPMRSASQP